jgi:hypothetical protein
VQSKCCSPFSVMSVGYLTITQVSITEELLGRKSSGSVIEIREYGRGDPLHSPRDTVYPQKLVLTSPTNGGTRPVYFARGLRPRSLVCFKSKSIGTHKGA